MKKLLSYVILFVLGTVTAAAQATMAYDVKGTVGTYEEITGGTVIGAGLKGEDFAEKVFDRDGHAIATDTVTQGFPIGFDFKFNNKLMNQFAVSSTGYMLLGKDSVSVCNSSQNTINIISQAGVKDLLGVMPRTNTYGLDDTEISYKLIGTAPNRTLVVQYKNLAQNTRLWEDNFIPVQLQIRLHESDSSFDIIFKDWKPNDEDMITYLTIKISAKGDGDDILLLGDSYTHRLRKKTEIRKSKTISSKSVTLGIFFCYTTTDEYPVGSRKLDKSSNQIVTKKKNGNFGYDFVDMSLICRCLRSILSTRRNLKS